jgi:DNA-binding transcriptional ArsR family regulator
VTTSQARTRAIRDFILKHVHAYPASIAKVTADAFEISRQATNQHLSALLNAGLLSASGTTKGRRYTLAVLRRHEIAVALDQRASEDAIWRLHIAPSLADLPRNVRDIWHYGCTEMINNAIDHSGGSTVVLRIQQTAVDTEVMIADDGIGIFRKIKEALQLEDLREGILELAKGKLTTDPSRHTGEGIFFSSRMFDEYTIVSGGLFFSHLHGAPEDWLLEASAKGPGTAVYMRLANDADRTMSSVFDAFASSDEDFAFRSTVVPVRLAQIGQDNLVSRSQARRLVARFDQFSRVVLDFSGVPLIGQAFADEVFRVFATNHPSVDLIVSDANAEVAKTIRRARASIAR